MWGIGQPNQRHLTATWKVWRLGEGQQSFLFVATNHLPFAEIYNNNLLRTGKMALTTKVTGFPYQSMTIPDGESIHIRN